MRKTEQMDIYEALDIAEEMIVKVAERKRTRLGEISNEGDLFYLVDDLTVYSKLMNKVLECKTPAAIKKILLKNHDIARIYKKDLKKIK